MFPDGWRFRLPLKYLNARVRILQVVSYKGSLHHYFNTRSALEGGCYTHEHEHEQERKHEHEHDHEHE